MSTNTDILVTVRGRDLGASDVLNNIGNSAEKSMSSFSDSVKKAGVIATGVLAGIVIAGSKMLDVASNIEQARVSFETMTGSAKIAGDLMQRISDFAVKTPFELPGVIQAAKQLMAMGSSVENVLPNLKMLGDLAAGTGAPLDRLVMNFGQVQLQGKLTGRELRDFAVNGVGLLEQLAQQMGKTTEQIMDMTGEGQIGFEEVKKAFENMTSGTGKFADLMEKQAKTFGGTMSNIRDQITRTSAEIMGMNVNGDIREGSIFALAKKSAEGLLETMNKIAPMLTKFADAVVNNQSAVFAILGGVLAMITVAVVGFLAAMAGGLTALAGFLAVGVALGLWISSLIDSFKKAKESVTTFWIPALSQAREWVTKTFAEIIVWFDNLKNKVSTSISSLGSSISSGFSEAVNALATFFTSTIPNAFNTVVGVLSTAWNNIVSFAKALPGMLAEGFVTFITQTLPFVIGFLVGFFTVSFPQMMEQLKLNLIAFGMAIIAEISTWPLRVQAWILNLVAIMQQAFADLGLFIHDWAITTGLAIIAEVSTWPSRFGAWITAMATFAIGVILKFGNDTKEKVVTTGSNIVAEISTWPSRVMAWLNTLPGLASQMMSDLWNAFSGWLGKVGNLFEDWKNKAVGAWNAVTGAIQGAIDKAREAFNKGVSSGSGLHFATGGVVPGPIGSPVVATVHGGETISPVGRVDSAGGNSGGGINFEVHIGLYAGSETEKRNIAKELYASLLQLATSQNKSVTEFMGG